ASSLRAYHWTYRTDVSPRKIADFLILNPFTPRSMHYCYRALGDRLNGLGRLYGRRHACHDEVNEALTMLSDLTIDQIFATGLHEFLDEFIGRTARLHGSIASAYHFAESGMKLRVEHRTVYRYEPAVRLVVQILRLRPSQFDGQRVVEWRI